MGRGGLRPGAGRKPNHLKRLVIRAGDLARLSQEEIQSLDAIARKLTSDAPQNQIESKPVIETAVTIVTVGIAAEEPVALIVLLAAP